MKATLRFGPERGRPGFTLIECVLCVFLLSIVGVMGFQILSRLYRFDAAGTHLEDVQRQRLRLERTWREDIHLADSIVRPAEDGQSDDLELRIDGTTIRYSASEEGSVSRRVSRDQTPMATDRWDVDGTLQFRRSGEGSLVTMELGAPRWDVSSGHDPAVRAGRPDPLQVTVIEASAGTSRARRASPAPGPAQEGTR